MNQNNKIERKNDEQQKNNNKEILSLAVSAIIDYLPNQAYLPKYT